MSINDDFWAALDEKTKKKIKNGELQLTPSDQRVLNVLNSLENDIDNDLTGGSDLNRTYVGNDIAPVKEDKPSWFQKGAFEDGSDGFWDFLKNLGKTTVGTLTDVEENVNTAVVDATENLIDTTAHAVGVVGGWFDKGFREDVNQFVAKEILKPEETGKFMTKYLSPLGMGQLNSMVNNGETEENSILGEKADGLVQSGAHLVGSAALAYLGVPTWLTMGVNAFGSEIESAAQQGATFMEGTNSAVVSTAAEILFEKISGGIKMGGNTLDDLAKPLFEGIKNKLGRTILKYTTDMVGEAGEEVLTEAASAVGRKFTYMSDKEWDEVLSSEDLFDAAIGGAIMSGVAGGGKIGKSVAQGRDYTTGLTDNEAKVVDKLYQEELAKQEADGKKLKLHEKNELKDKIVERMERGYISTDTIESVLGGKSYESYKSALDSENADNDQLNALTNEYNELNKKKLNDMTGEEQDRRDELKKLIPELKQKVQENENLGNSKKLKEQLGKDVFEMVKGRDRLVESYNEKIRASQDYVADFDKYKGTKHEDAAKKTIENAVKAGANNTNAVHDIVDMAASLSSETGYVYDFKDNDGIKQDFIERKTNEIAKLEAIENRTDAQNDKIAKLKELVEQVKNDEVTVNGNIDSNGIVLNLDSQKPLNRIVGHEITHSLEKSKRYDKLRDSLFAYAKTKGVDIDSELEMKALEYEGIEGTTAEAELVADMVGDYLFTDSDFVNDLTTKNRNIAQWLYDEVKYLLTKATTGSKEERELLRVKHEFENAFREDAENTKADSAHEDAGVKHSFSSTANTFFGDANMSAQEFRKKDYTQTEGYKNYVDQCLNNMRQTRADFDESIARKEIEKQIDGIIRVALASKEAGYDIIDDAKKRDTKDSKNRLLFSSLEPNSEYFTSNDISTICDKRQNFAEIYDDIVRAEEEKGVPKGKRFFDNVDNYFYLHKILADKGLTQPCRQCYVESMRKNLAPMANAFLRLVNETDANNKANDQLYQQKGKNKGNIKSNNAKLRERVLEIFEEHPEYHMSASDLTVETLTTEDGLAQLKIQAPLIYEAFNSFYGQSKPKMPKAATPFRFGELTALLTDEKGKIKQSLVDKINSTGGFRLQSYSDFQIQNYTDVLQVIFEAGTLGLNGHAYTKVPAFLEATEGTNLKRNISIFMYKDGNEWKLDRNDSFPYELEEIYDIVKADKSGNTGIIAVSQNKEMSAWIMANDNIAQGIPFHKSGLKMGTVRDTDVKTDDGRTIKGYSGTIDHTKQQTEVWAKTTADHKALTKVKNGINIYGEEVGWDFDNKDNLSKNELIEKNVKSYIDACERAGYLPKFRDYVINNGTVLKDVLKYSKELGFVSQDATIEDISFEHKGYTIPYGYYKFLGDFSMFTPDGKASPHDTLSLNDYDFDKAENFFADAEGLRRKEILQQFANGEERKKYRDSGMSAGELTDVVRQKRSEVVDDVVGKKYSIAKNAKKADADYMSAVKRGDTEAAQVMVDEAAKNAGYTRKLYHGTASKFNVFGFGRTGIFTTDNYDMAKTYGDNVISLYGKEGANVLTIDAQESPHYAIRVSKDVLDFSEYPLIGKKETYSTNDISLIAFREGYDVVVINNVYDNYSAASGNTENGLGTDVVYKDPNQVKSSEAITYDDEGNVIPLSERFNSANDDMRYSFSKPDDEFAPISDLDFYGKDFRVQPSQDDIAPVQDVAKNATTNEMPMPDSFAPKSTDILSPLRNMPVLPDDQLESGSYAAIRPQREKQPSMKKVGGANAKEQIANVMTETPKAEKKKGGMWSTFVRNFVDKGAVFETDSLKTKNRALQDTYKAIGRSETKAQYFMEHGKDGVKSLDSIRSEVEQSGKTKEFYEYLHHKHNVDRMSLESKELPNLERLEGEMKKLKLLKLQENQLRAIASEKITAETPKKRRKVIETVKEYLASKDVTNKPVFGYSVTAEMSQDIASKYESSNPEFKEYAKDVYDYMNHLRKMMVTYGLISPETAKLWSEKYPHYIPIHRAGVDGLAVNVPLDTYKTGINAPIKRATGGNKDILPLFDTMAERTIQTFKAIDKNRFGIELKNTLGSEIESVATSLDEAIDSVDTHESLLQEGKNGANPTFTVFDGGERVTFEITDEMYKAMKPTSEGLSYTNKVLNKASNLHRRVLTEYSLPFALKNAIKDTQDVLLNSQHPARTYANFPVAIKELTTKGKWYTEYMENGGGDNTYFDKRTNTFTKEKSALRRIVGFPLDKIIDVNNFIERVPRLAEYIASRQKGASVDAAMLDAARITTDFSAGGDVTKFLNRNGATFLNASVQGFAQNVRNVREAKANGLKGWVGLAAKVTLAGLPAVLLNNLLWDDDEEYEELSDYVKDNYYVVAKYGDGKFVRIPKGRASAVIQDAFEQIGNTLTGNDEADWGNFFELVMSNLAPNNPIDNNIVAPIMQVANNETWYGEDLVPTRLQDLPAAEQYDESTDSISKWLGEKTNKSPYKINYLLNQYGGGVSDIVLPMLTPEAESGDNSLGGNFIAPMKDMFTTDGVMNNQNVSDFYDKVDELTVNANSSNATDEDILKSKYINSVNTEIGKLYGKKREIQNSNLSDATKYSQVKDVQDQINALARESLNAYNSVSIDGGYATVGDKHYRLEDGTWTKISDKQLERQNEVTEELGISPSEYWDKTEISYFPMSNGEYEYAYDNPEKYAIAKAVGGYDSYRTYSKELSNISADKDANGKSINGTKKPKVIDYLNGLDIDYGAKLILLKSQYPAEDSYNMDIINYINENDNLTYDERVTILEELGFKIVNGKIYWD